MLVCQVRGDLPRGGDKSLAIGFGERTVSPVIAVIIPFHRAGPVLVQGKIKAFDGYALARRVCKCRPIEQRAESSVPSGPINLQSGLIPEWCATVLDPSGLIVWHAVEHGPVPVSQTIIAKLVFRKAVAIHLRQEAQMVR